MDTTHKPVDNNVRLLGRRSSLPWIIVLIVILALLAWYFIPKLMHNKGVTGALNHATQNTRR